MLNSDSTNRNICEQCGCPISDHPRDFRSEWPERLVKLPTNDWFERKWGNDDLLEVEGVGSYIRIVIKVRVKNAEPVTYRVWLEVFPEDLLRAWEIWNSPAYNLIKMKGVLANRLAGWSETILHQMLEVEVQAPNELPVAVASPHAELNKIITSEWDESVVLTAINHSP
ncbi:DUF2199 domain-containing protein [Pirellulaceae bacterium SH501]